MKPFDLEAALAGAPVVTRDGRKVTELHLFEANITLPLAVYIEENISIHMIGKNGRYSPKEDYEDNMDLFMAPVKRKGWVNIYEQMGGIYADEDTARANAGNAVATVKVEWEE